MRRLIEFIKTHIELDLAVGVLIVLVTLALLRAYVAIPGQPIWVWTDPGPSREEQHEICQVLASDSLAVEAGLESRSDFIDRCLAWYETR